MKPRPNLKKNKPSSVINLKKVAEHFSNAICKSKRLYLPSMLSIAIAIFAGFMIAEISRIPVPHSISIRAGYAMIGLPGGQLDSGLSSDRSLGKSVKLAILTAPNLGEKCLFKTKELILISTKPNPTILIKLNQIELLKDLIAQLKKQKLSYQLISSKSPHQLPNCLG